MTFKTGTMIAVIAGIGGLGAPTGADDGPTFEMWPDCTIPPQLKEMHYLPVLGDNEEPGFIDLGFNVERGGLEWRAMQFSRDKEIEHALPVGTYFFGLVGDEWPPDTVDVTKELLSCRLIRVEIDGHIVRVGTSCLMDLSSNEQALGLYNICPRFIRTGKYTVKYVWQQRQPFYFVYPFDQLEPPLNEDPLGLDGRRVFLPVETVGDSLDDEIVLTYRLKITPEVLSSATAPRAAADTDGDGDVDVSDLLTVILDWGREGSESKADVNLDGGVDVKDLVVVLSEWSEH